MRLARAARSAALVGFADIGVLEPVNRVGNAAGRRLEISLLSISLLLPTLIADTLASCLRSITANTSSGRLNDLCAARPHFGLCLRRQAEQQHGEAGKKALFHQTLPCILLILARYHTKRTPQIIPHSKK